MAKVPLVPLGISRSDFGKVVMRWGTFDASARSRMVTLTRAKLVASGVTVQMAREWRDFYLEVVRQTPDNPGARGRAELMQRAIELLEQQL